MINPYRVNELLENPGLAKAAYALCEPEEKLIQELKGEGDLTRREIMEITRYCELDASDILDIFFYESLQERVARNIRKLNGEEFEEIAALAKEAGLNPYSLYRKVANAAIFDLNDLDAISKALDVPVSLLVSPIC